MKRIIILTGIVAMLTMMVSCSSSNNSQGSLVGVWTEYRADGDDYLLSTFVFNSDGSGLFRVNGNPIRTYFTWSQSGPKVYINFDDGDTDVLSYNNGLLVEHSAFGEVVYKKR